MAGRPRPLHEPLDICATQVVGAMAAHWFDTLNKALVGDIPRRPLLNMILAIVVSIVFSTAPTSDAAKHRKKGNGKGHGNRKHKRNHKRNDDPKPAESCSGGACRAVWPSDSE